ncbi:MAG TPA: tetratricopeptide repeat protein, partial [Planctomycetota bacterium]|nr:tetratricopeptide repeat protein [Planctomycetota bacterium]
VMAAGVLAPLIFVIVYFRRRGPLISLAVVFFLAAIAANANILFTVETIFAERLAATASFGLPLLLCALARTQPLARHRILFLAALALLTILYGARTWARNSYWAEPDKMDLRLPEDAPDSTWSHFKAAEWHLEKHSTASGEEKKLLLEAAKAHAERSLQIHPGNGRAAQLAASILMQEQRYEEAAEHLITAGRLLADETPPIAEPRIFRFRGECYLRLGKWDKAIEDFKTYLVLLRTLGGQPGEAEAALLVRAQDLAFYKVRGLALAGSGKLTEALSDFDAAVRHLPELPETWNNRGFCRFKLKDLDGALEDYQRGLELCREKKISYAPRPADSVWSFSRSIAEVHEEVARAERAAGNDAAALEAETEAGKWKAEADRLAPPPAEVTPPR